MNHSLSLIAKLNRLRYNSLHLFIFKIFRLIFALDPFHGELSRAMRNRCVEIHLPSDSFNDNFTLVEGKDGTEQVGLTWDEVNLIIKSKCTNAEELILAKKMAHNSGKS